jgi:GNAT superfamily N-acetyltransferase
MVAAAQEELTQRYGSGDANPIESVQFDPPEGIFLVAWLDGQPVGCGGWRTLSHFADTERAGGDGGETAEDVAEIKRMYVSPTVRNAGVATALLAALEASARSSGMRRMILETGLAQPEAIALYTKMGYEKIANYGHYKDEPDCVSFGRDL